jgi:hypothetical protein
MIDSAVAKRIDGIHFYRALCKELMGSARSIGLHYTLVN